MALTRDFKQTVKARIEKDAAYREALFAESLNAFLSGDTATGKILLRDLINSTVGFEDLASEVHKSGKSLHRMLSPGGNPTTENFFELIRALQKKTKMSLEVSAGGRSSPR